MTILFNMLAILPLSITDIMLKRIEDGNGFLITIIGLMAVFLGLVVLWGVTSMFPRITARLEGKTVKKETAPATQDLEANSDQIERDKAIAIGVALCCELEDEDVSVITLRHIEQDISPWVVASRPTTMRH